MHQIFLSTLYQESTLYHFYVTLSINLLLFVFGFFLTEIIKNKIKLTRNFKINKSNLKLLQFPISILKTVPIDKTSLYLIPTF